MRDKIVEENINGHCKECSDKEVTASTKLSRRNFVKAAGAGALYLALPNLGKIPKMGEIDFDNPKLDPVGGEPLVILIKNNELRGFRGLDEIVVTDNGLVEGLSSRYMDEPDSDFSEDNPIVILVKDDKSIKFRGLREFAIEDSDLSRRLSSKFKTKVGG